MLSEGEKLRAQRLQIGGRSYAAIGHKMGKPPAEVRKLLSKYVGKPRGRHKTKPFYAMGGEFGRIASGVTFAHDKPPPAEVLAERERAEQEPRTLTALICGDPPPGRSALDKRRIRLVFSR